MLCKSHVKPSFPIVDNAAYRQCFVTLMCKTETIADLESGNAQIHAQEFKIKACSCLTEIRFLYSFLGRRGASFNSPDMYQLKEGIGRVTEKVELGSFA